MFERTLRSTKFAAVSAGILSDGSQHSPGNPCVTKGRKRTGSKKGRQGGTQQEDVGRSLEGDDDANDRHQPVQQCKEEFCLKKEGHLEALLEKRRVFMTAKKNEASRTESKGPERETQLSQPSTTNKLIYSFKLGVPGAAKMIAFLDQPTRGSHHSRLFEPGRKKFSRKYCVDPPLVQAELSGDRDFSTCNKYTEPSLVLCRRMAMQEASVRARRRKAAASARAAVSEAARDDKQEEVRHPQHWLHRQKETAPFPTNGFYPPHHSTVPRGTLFRVLACVSTTKNSNKVSSSQQPSFGVLP